MVVTVDEGSRNVEFVFASEDEGFEMTGTIDELVLTLMTVVMVEEDDEAAVVLTELVRGEAIADVAGLVAAEELTAEVAGLVEDVIP